MVAVVGGCCWCWRLVLLVLVLVLLLLLILVLLVVVDALVRLIWADVQHADDRVDTSVVRDTSCCDHPLTAVPFLRLGPRTDRDGCGAELCRGGGGRCARRGVVEAVDMVAGQDRVGEASPGHGKSSLLLHVTVSS